MRQTCSCAAAGAAAGEHERLQRLELGVDLVAGLLEPRRLLGREPQALAVAAVRDRDVGADVEQVVLDAPQEAGEALVERRQRERDAELGVELVHRPVGLDPRVRLGYPAHVAEVGLAVVAEARVDAGEIDGHGAGATVTSRPFRVGGSGKPVQIRRGPATVTGDAHRIRATVPQRGTGRRERVEPGSQETCLRPSPFEALAEKGLAP